MNNYIKYSVENLIPITTFNLMIKKSCIGWPCTTCGGRELEKETIKQLKIFNKKNKLISAQSNLKNIFIEAMCKVDMKQMSALKEMTETSTAPYSGSMLPYWSVYLKNISKNDITHKSERLTFSFDYKEIYTYWINNRLNEIDLVDFMIFYNQYVPKTHREKLFKAGLKLVSLEDHKSLKETLKYRVNDFENF